MDEMKNSNRPHVHTSTRPHVPMRLAGLAIYSYALPLAAAISLKGRKVWRREGLLLRLEADTGAVGWGEAAPLPGFSAESLAAAGTQLQRLARGLPGREVDAGNPGLAEGLLEGPDGLAPSVRFGLELALYNLCAAHRQVPLHEVLFSKPRKIVFVNGLLEGAPEAVLQQARRMRDAGYRAVKLKVGRRPPAEEIDLVRQLAEVLEGAVQLRLDANRAWRLEEALRFAQATAGCAVEYIEEPLADPGGLAHFARAAGLPLALDETLVGLPADALAQYRYARAVVLKPTLLGGISNCLQLARRAVEFGMQTVVSAAYESGIGTLGLVALAAGLGPRAIPAGLDTYRRLAADVIRPRLDREAAQVEVVEILGRTYHLNRHLVDFRF